MKITESRNDMFFYCNAPHWRRRYSCWRRHQGHYFRCPCCKGRNIRLSTHFAHRKATATECKSRYRMQIWTMLPLRIVSRFSLSSRNFSLGKTWRGTSSCNSTFYINFPSFPIKYRAARCRARPNNTRGRWYSWSKGHRVFLWHRGS
jgi:hypothetical protein